MRHSYYVYLIISNRPRYDHDIYDKEHPLHVAVVQLTVFT